MGASKLDSFPKAQTDIAALMKALGHPARVAILEHLIKVKACIGNDIVDILPLSQPTISQHLRELKNVGIIKGSVEKNSICYCLNEKKVEQILNYIKQINFVLEEDKKCC
jgi:ArsR family transcriptional regulator|tara:strand:- start:60164 stop:60493 length:330 start_codon:yes stop_codon:yes gene_type:complete